MYKSWYQETYVDNDFVICREDGTCFTPFALNQRYRKDVKKAKLPYIRFHDLRHTHATMLLSLGENPKVVSERLGHSTVQMTLDTYSHVLPNLQENLSENLGRALAENSAKNKCGQ